MSRDINMPLPEDISGKNPGDAGRLEYLKSLGPAITELMRLLRDSASYADLEEKAAQAKAAAVEAAAGPTEAALVAAETAQAMAANARQMVLNRDPRFTTLDERIAGLAAVTDAQQLDQARLDELAATYEATVHESAVDRAQLNAAVKALMAAPPGGNGPMGPVGPEGARGEAGPQGLVGPQGEEGPPGPAGPRGPQGDPGPAGVDGVAGPRGETGAVGPRGEQGPKGDAGATGLTGLTGAQGVKGDTGAQGPKGDTGPAGPQGPPGSGALPSAARNTSVVRVNGSLLGIGGTFDATLTLTPPLKDANYVCASPVLATLNATILGQVSVVSAVPATASTMTVRLRNSGLSTLDIPVGAITAVAVYPA